MMLCTRCHAAPRVEGQRWCRGCRAEWMRQHRKPLTDEQRRKDRARSYAGVYLRRGKLQRLDCEDCGSTESEMHHPDYSRPLWVTWLCRSCHLARHRAAA